VLEARLEQANLLKKVAVSGRLLDLIIYLD
jgi:hypothetical protein